MLVHHSRGRDTKQQSAESKTTGSEASLSNMYWQSDGSFITTLGGREECVMRECVSQVHETIDELAKLAPSGLFLPSDFAATTE